jgi:lathosterol oxidase
MTMSSFREGVLVVAALSALVGCWAARVNSSGTGSSDNLTFWHGDTAQKISLMKQGSHNPYREFNEWVNALFYTYSGLDFLPPLLRSFFSSLSNAEEVSYYAVCYVRDLVAGTGVYWGTAGLWHLIIYNLLGQQIFEAKNRKRPTAKLIFGQMQLAQSSLLIYAGLPVLSEYLIESGWTRTYFYIDQIGGWPFYLAYLALYILVVEIGIYWMHRTLHTNKILYKYVHELHHQYKSPEMLTPWASIAFNPLDGILQACPYVIALFFVPCHYFTHVGLLFFSGVWATNIHDSVVSLSPARTRALLIFFDTLTQTSFFHSFSPPCLSSQNK